MKSLLVFFAIFCQVFSCKAQLMDFYQYPEKIPNQYLVSQQEEVSKVRFAMRGFKLNPEDSLAIYQTLVPTQQNLVSFGRVFLDYDRYEQYLNNILNVLMDSYHLETSVKPKVYLGFQSMYNAYTLYNGTICFNIGTFSALHNEAEIAGLLSHELAHFILNHVGSATYRQYVLFDSIYNNNFFRGKKQVTDDIMEFSRLQETQADSLGQEILKMSPYHTKGSLGVMTTIDSITHHYGQYRAFGWGHFRERQTTHPVSSERIAYLKNHMGPETGKYFIQEKEEFFRLKKMAIKEELAVALKEKNIRYVVESAFYHYLKEPGDKDYILFLIESCRLLDFYSGWDDNSLFILNYYYLLFSDLATQSVMKKIGKIYPDLADTSLIKDKYLLQHPEEVTTYVQAYQYFVNKAVKEKIPEAYLMAAMSKNSDPEQKTKYLKAYLNAPGMTRKAYAQFFMDDLQQKTKKEKGEKTLLVFVDYTSAVEYKNWKVDKDWQAQLAAMDHIDEKMKEIVSKYPNAEYLNLYRNKESNISFLKSWYNYIGISGSITGGVQASRSYLYFDESFLTLFKGKDIHEYDKIVLFSLAREEKATSASDLLTKQEEKKGILLVLKMPLTGKSKMRRMRRLIHGDDLQLVKSMIK